MRSIYNTCWILMATASFLAAADAPYVGKWKLNPAKSQLAGEQVSVEQTPSGGMRLVTPTVSYEFKVDGKEYPVPGGTGTVSWKEVSPTTWDITARTNGQVTATLRLVLKGDTLTQSRHNIKPDGGTSESSVTLTRVSGGPGLFGKWKSTELKTSASSMEIASNGADGVIVTYPDSGSACSGKFDGKDYPVIRRNVPSKVTWSFKKASPGSFDMTEKIEGKAVYVDTFAVSPDGKTLSDDGTPVSAKEPTKAVYDRQ
jgi:hypothetical protein